MATPTEKIAASLEVLRKLQKDGRCVVKSAQLSRVHRERLLKHGLLQPVMKGWLMRSGPDATPVAASAFWDFCALYCKDRFGKDWYLSPEQSILLQTGATAIPRRVVVYTPRGTNNTVELPFGTSIYDLRYRPLAAAADLTESDGLRLLETAAALLRIPERFFVDHPAAARLALAHVVDSSDVTGRLLEGGHSAVGGRLAGAFRRTGRADVADEILAVMKAAGYDVRETDPFAAEQAPPKAPAQVPPIVTRMQGLWESMRETVVATFPAAPGLRWSAESYIRFVDDVYARDAYHSLALEGHRVTPELVDRIRSGRCDPATAGDRSDDDALARGYWRAFQAVKATLARVLAGDNPGAVARTAYHDWQRELLHPLESAAGIPPAAGAASGGDGVEPNGKRHVPPRWNAVHDAMPALFDLLETEPEASVRAVLGHWMFGYIHRYPEGDGRVARFVMNVMLASGGYPWTVIRIEDQSAYRAALESASAEADIQPLARMLAERVRWSMERQPP